MALNLFIADLYGPARVVADGVFPAELLASSVNYRPQCQGVRPPQGVRAAICGSDLVRDADGTMYVLEDNLRVPSGVSYMLQNRQVTKRVFADLFRDLDIQPVDDYPNKLAGLLAALSPRPGATPVIAVLTPGVFNSAYFEHAFLAQQMGAHLVEGKDLVVDDDCVYMRTIGGLVRVDVIYRRVDDLFLDPEVFRADSTLGVPGLIRAWRAGKVAIANAPGAGVADDKVVYAYRARTYPLLPGRGAPHPQRPDLALPPRRRAPPRAFPSGGDGRQTGQRVRRLRHFYRLEGDRAGNGRVAAAGRGQPP